MDCFAYLGVKVTSKGDSELEVNIKLAKARYAFAALKNLWNTRKINYKIKVYLYKSNVLSVLLYGCDMWKMSKTISHNVDVFYNKCLQRILKIFWPNTTMSEEL